MSCIFVLQRGWVVVGQVESEQENLITLTHTSCIRRWGTTKGLGELAEKGPFKNTVLDKKPKTRFHPLTVVQSIECSEKWNDYFSSY